MIASLLIAIPGLLLMVVPVLGGLWLMSVVIVVIGTLIKQLGFAMKTWIKPHIHYVHLTDAEIEDRYRDIDIKKHGYNPMRHDFHIKELFPRKPDLEKIKAAAKQLFPNRHHQLFPIKTGADDYQTARSFLTNMAVERHQLLAAGQWSETKEKQWTEMPHLPKVMREVDDEFVNWCFLAVGREVEDRIAS
jgi:hypothetical protein